MTISVEDEEQWRALCGVMRMEDLADAEPFATMESRHTNRRELDAMIGGWTETRQARWVMTRLQQAGVPSGMVMNERDALEDRHLHARDFWHELTHPESGTHRYVNTLWQANRTPNAAPRRHAPRLGEDNEYVYRELLGFTDAEYRRFEEEGHIGMDYDPSVP